MSIKSSIKFKKLWVATPGADGSLGTDWQAVEFGTREATAQLNGSDGNVTNYKNIIGKNIESGRTAGDITLVMQLADLTPAVMSTFTGGQATTTADGLKYSSAENLNETIELSVRILTNKGLVVTMPRVSFDSYPMFNDDDLHYYQINGVLLQPEDTAVAMYDYVILDDLTKTDITSFSFGTLDSGAATIDTTAHTVAITVTVADASALTPVIGVDLGAGISPRSGLETDFSSPVTYTVTAADGTTQDWVVTVTTTP